MKHIKKVFAFALTLVMAFALALPAFADTQDGQESNGTITVSNAAIGNEYKAYKILDASIDGENIAYTTNEDLKGVIGASGSPFTVSETADANGNYSVTTSASSSVISEWIKNNLASFTPISASEGVDASDIATASTIKWTDLDYGYYYITSGLGSEVTIDSVNPSAAVIDKNDTTYTEPEKEADQTTAQIGDEVKFTVEFNATNWDTPADATSSEEVTKITKYDVADTPNGYDIDANSVKVTVDGTDITSTITGKTLGDNGVLTFTIPWVDAEGNHLYASPAKVVIEYKGTVNAAAFAGAAINEVNITNDADDKGKGDNSETKNYNLTINKTDGSDPLTGAKFELWRQNATSAMSLILLTDEEKAAANITGAENTVYYRVAYTGETGTTTIDMTNATSAVIYGLDGADTYTIKEIQAPSGYNLIGDTNHAMENKDGSETIVNNAGTVLPSTGGIGTTIFYIVGGIMVVGAVVVLLAKRRAASTEE